MNFDLSKVVDIRLLSIKNFGDFIDVQREMVYEDGTVIPGKHRFPTDILEWRAAEYDIDQNDLDTLLDIVLWEPFLEEDDQPELSLHQAPTINEARDRHLKRIKERKSRGSSHKAMGADPIRDQLKVICDMHPEAIAIKRELVKEARIQFQEEREREAKANLRALVTPGGTPGKTPVKERLEKLRSAMKRVPIASDTRTRPRPQLFKESKNGLH